MPLWLLALLVGGGVTAAVVAAARTAPVWPGMNVPARALARPLRAFSEQAGTRLGLGVSPAADDRLLSDVAMPSVAELATFVSDCVYCSPLDGPDVRAAIASAASMGERDVARRTLLLIARGAVATGLDCVATSQGVAPPGALPPMPPGGSEQVWRWRREREAAAVVDYWCTRSLAATLGLDASAWAYELRMMCIEFADLPDCSRLYEGRSIGQVYERNYHLTSNDERTPEGASSPGDGICSERRRGTAAELTAIVSAWSATLRRSSDDYEMFGGGARQQVSWAEASRLAAALRPVFLRLALEKLLIWPSAPAPHPEDEDGAWAGIGVAFAILVIAGAAAV